MNAIRVLVVDDSAVIRNIMVKFLGAETGIEVVGTASNGQQALEQIGRLSPDIVTLDVEMPVMNGLDAVAEIRKRWRDLPVIMMSTLTASGSDITYEALARGASAFVEKPASMGGGGANLKEVQAQLARRIRALSQSRAPARPAVDANPGAAGGIGGGSVGGAGTLRARTSLGEATGRVMTGSPRPATGIGAAARRSVSTHRPGGANTATASTSSGANARSSARAPFMRSLGTPVKVVVIGSSTGGPNALNEQIPMIPADFHLPILIAQHMPPRFTQQLANQLASRSQIQVEEARNGVEVQPGKAWIAPGQYHMVVQRGAQGMEISTNQDPPENFCRPAADVLFRSAAQAYGSGVLAVVLTGMGKDACKGCEVIRKAGGSVIAQDQKTSVVWGMPGFVTKAGLANDVLPLAEIIPRVLRMCGYKSRTAIAGKAR
ncbi:MAG: chemotaxis response regulator protein-glutamate methylesterase [Gammaproteobacteria bacterium]|nr:chemotaxis response regulator protein-glutamate methylesterase [Gammaproteobacteria bacterium]